VYDWRFADRSLFVMIIEREKLDLASKSSGAGRLRMRCWSTYEFNHKAQRREVYEFILCYSLKARRA
jgi:hypothetical protein